MRLSCLLGHKWDGLTCVRCGNTRKAITVLCESALYKCHVCQTTGKFIEELESEKAARLEHLNAGLVIDMNRRVMFFCKECNSFICSTCTLDDREARRCPLCQATFDFDSLADETTNPVEMLALAAQRKTIGLAVRLVDAGKRSISVIKVIREVTRLGLEGAKAILGDLPSVVKERLSRDEAAAVKIKFEEVGARVEVIDAAGQPVSVDSEVMAARQRATLTAAASENFAPGRTSAGTDQKGDLALQLVTVGPLKIDVIKIIREVTGLDLIRAKEIADGVPRVVKEGLSRDEAAAVKMEFEKVGAQVEVVGSSSTEPSQPAVAPSIGKKESEDNKDAASPAHDKPPTQLVEDIVEGLRQRSVSKELCSVVLFGDRPLAAILQVGEADILCFTQRSKAESFMQGYQRIYLCTKPLSALALGHISELWAMLNNKARDENYEPPHGLIINFNYSGQPYYRYSLADLKGIGLDGLKKGFSALPR